MPILKSSYQKNQTLQEFYNDFALHQNEIFAKGARQMIDFIEMIDKVFPMTHIWAHTSHTRLAIQPIDDRFLTHYIYVSNIGMDEFYFEYKLPKDKQPWNNAWVIGKAKSLEEAKKYLIISMEKSGKWEGNSELIGLLTYLNIDDCNIE